jgi:uncharacterized membrane protein (DUF2068 family)
VSVPGTNLYEDAGVIRLTYFWWPPANSPRDRYDGIVRQTAIRTSHVGYSRQSKPSSSLVLVLIGLFKLAKALLLVVVGIGAIKFLHKDLAAAVMHWVQLLRIDPDNALAHRIIARVFRVTPKQLRELSVGTFLYAGLFMTEGLGLLFRKRWAEYFTILTTGGLIPLEIYEMSRHFTVAKVVVTLVNILIVWYLAARVRSH